MTYQIITDATADLNDELLAGLPEVKIIPMHVQVNGREYLFGPGGNIEVVIFTHFYETDSLLPPPRSIPQPTGSILRQS